MIDREAVWKFRYAELKQIYLFWKTGRGL